MPGLFLIRTGIILSTGTLYTHPLKDIFFVAKEAGFDGLESVLNKNICGKNVSSTFPSLLRILPVISLHAPFMSCKGWGRQGQFTAEDSGVGRGTLHPFGAFPSSLLGQPGDRVLELAQRYQGLSTGGRKGKRRCHYREYAASGGELKFNGYLWARPRSLLRFITESNLYLTYDCAHMGTHKSDFIDDFSTFFVSGRIKNIHLSDYGRGKQHLLPGRGALPLTRFLLQLKRLNYTGLLTLESMPAEFPPEEEEIIRVLRDIVDYVRAQIE